MNIIVLLLLVVTVMFILPSCFMCVGDAIVDIIISICVN